MKEMLTIEILTLYMHAAVLEICGVEREPEPEPEIHEAGMRAATHRSTRRRR